MTSASILVFFFAKRLLLSLYERESKMNQTNVCLVGVFLLLSILGLVACNDSTGPGIEPEITNAADQFEYQVSSIQNYTGTISYTWQITGTAADVNLANAVTSGSATITILDNAGTEVFTASFAENGTQETDEGTAGSWTITIVYTSYTGDVNFRVQKDT